MFQGIRYPTKQQGIIWLKRRQKTLPSKIATNLKVSRPYVSQAQRIAEDRIENLLKHTASVNMIDIRNLSSEYGIAEGHCHEFDSDTYITYSPMMGIRTWFTHSGNCSNCSKLDDCKQVIKNLAKEWKIPLPKNKQPTLQGDFLFKEIKRRLKWE